LGQSTYGGFILSANVRALDQLLITNDHPFRFPWLFKYLGDQKIVAYVATLGPESFFKDTLLAGYKWMIKPHANLELGLSNVMQIGGDGAPNYGVSDFAGDFIGFSSTSNSVSNRILGFDGRLRMPLLNGVEAYFEAFWDDKTFASLKRTLIDTSAYKFGFFIPKLTWDGRLSATFETKFISELFYRHSQFQSGYTLNNEILGDAWGPDSFGTTADLNYLFDSKSVLSGGLGYLSAGADTYRNTGSSITKIVSASRENHYFAHLKLQKKYQLFDAFAGFKYDRVSKPSFVSGSNNNIFFNLGISKNWN